MRTASTSTSSTRPACRWPPKPAAGRGGGCPPAAWERPAAATWAACSGAVRAFHPIAIEKTGDLNFGRIQLPASGDSKVTLNPGSGARTVSGSGFGYPTPAPTRGAFTASGEGGQSFSLTIPTKLTLTGPGTLVVDITVAGNTVPKLSGTLGNPGTYSFTVGGSFTINSATPTGVYTGVLSVSIDYN